MTASSTGQAALPTETAFVGLAPFLRLSISGTDYLPLAQEMLEHAAENPDDANLWMNLAIALFALGQRENGLAIQSQALALKRVYHLAALQQPARLRVLLLVVPGDLSANAPLDCLLEESDIDLHIYFITPGDPFAEPLPEHDVVVVGVGVGEGEACRDTLRALERALSNWPTPVVNRPQHIPSVGRAVASALLHDAPGIFIPPTYEASRAQLSAIASGERVLAQLFSNCEFPIIVRPADSHGGRGLMQITDAAELGGYLAEIDGDAFFISRFIDYSGDDGLFRKYRIGLIDGTPYACHMAISRHWMVHYVNAGMYEDASKRAEELAFMERFDQFAQRHQAALDAIHRRTQLDYLFIDCAETPDGQLFIFEIDHAMVVHAMDPEEMFPYKQRHMRKVSAAMRDYLLRLHEGAAGRTRCAP